MLSETAHEITNRGVAGTMRLWTIHPRYLDPQGLVALWREALLARKVLQGQTRGYRNHPQLERFRAQLEPMPAIDSYLASVYAEASARGYSFDAGKFEPVESVPALTATSGQVAYEWDHLLRKLAGRNSECHSRWRSLSTPECHPLFRKVPGPVASWERATLKPGRASRRIDG